MVGIGEYKAGRAPGIIVTSNLGSCVGIVLYEPIIKVGGLAHIRLSNHFALALKHSKTRKTPDIPGDYADTAIPLLLDKVCCLGGRKKHIVAKIAGGAFMYKNLNPGFGSPETINVGARNIQATQEILKNHEIKIIGEELLGVIPRTMELDLETGSVLVKTRGMKDRIL